MVTPWSTNAVEITQTWEFKVLRGWKYLSEDHIHCIDPMLTVRYEKLDQSLFTVAIAPETFKKHDIAAYNKSEGLSLNTEEIAYLNQLSEKLEGLQIQKSLLFTGKF